MDKILKTAVIFGATGMIGQYLRAELEADAAWEKVILAVRKVPNQMSSKESALLIDFDHLDRYPDLFSADSVFCCLGTTIKGVGGDKNAFRTIDAAYPIQIANLCATYQAGCFVVISSMGADKSSRIFYNRIKGEMEEGVSHAGIASTHIMRPSLLLGKRQENRLGEKIAQIVLPILAPLLMGSLKNMRPIHGSTVAKAMKKIAALPHPGTHIYLSEQIKEWANR